MTIKYSITKIHRGRALDEEEDLTLTELCRVCNSSTDAIIEMVEEGILEPRGLRISAWRFSFLASERVRKVQHLQRDLGVNLAGAALALHLLDRIAELEAGRGE